MEQDPNMLEAVVGWVLEQVVGVALGAIIGAVGAKWWFGKKNEKKLEELQTKVADLVRKGNGRPQRQPSHVASPTPATQSPATQSPAPQSPAPQSPLGCSAPESHTLPSSPHNALLSLQELIDLVADHTEMAAQRMLTPHKGRRHIVTGEVLDVTEYTHAVSVLIKTADGILVGLSFNRGPHDEDMAALRKGDEIVASGLLRTASSTISLENCSVDNVLSASSRS